MSGQVFGTGSDNISGFSWDNGTVGVSYESGGVWVSSISVVVVNSVVSPSSSVKSVISVSSKTICSPGWESLGGEVGGFSSLYFWGLSWSYGTIGVGDELSAGGSDRG